MAFRDLNWRFMLHGLALGLGLLALLLLGAIIALPHLFPEPPSGSPPPQPTILAPRGELPKDPVGLQEWARYEGETYRMVGSGFFFWSHSGDVVGATSAHSLELGNVDHVLDRVAFRIVGDDSHAVECTELYGDPGRPRFFGLDLTRDYVLLRLSGDVNTSLVIDPDPRGAPQPGERVVLYSSLDEAFTEGSLLEGAVLVVDEIGVWIIMDDVFEPGMLSGSPVLSQHTGKVIGMALTATLRGGDLILGVHPIGSLVTKADQASDFPSLRDFKR